MNMDQSSLTIQQYQKQLNQQQKETKKQDTEIYVWGTDKYGQLGLGHKHQGKNYTIPKICCYNLIIRTVSCGEEHSAFITQRGHIYTIGSNEDGKLGISTKTIPSSSTPCLVEDLSKIKCLSLSCGKSHTVAVMQNGEVYGWGDGAQGQLGNGSLEPRCAPTKVVSENNEFIQVQCGSRHTILLDLKKRAYVCGSNENGQLGLKNSKTEVFLKRLDARGIVEAACGDFHSILLDEQGRVYVSGANSFGQLGLGTKHNLYEFAQVQSLMGEQIVKIAAGSHSAALNKKGEIILWGTGVFGEYLLPQKINRNGVSFSDISVGNFFAAAVDINGTVWTWGANSNGELGLGDYESKTAPSLLQALKGRHVQKICCGGGFAMALGYKLPKENKSNPNEKTLDKSVLEKSLLEKSNYYSSQSHQMISLKHDDLRTMQNSSELNSGLKNYSTVSNYASTKPSLNQNYSMAVERTAPKLKESSHSPLQKSFHFEKKPSSLSTQKKLHRSDVSPRHSNLNVLKENNGSFGIEKKRKQSVEKLSHAKENQTLDPKRSGQLSSSVEQRSASNTKPRKKSTTISNSAYINPSKIYNFHSQVNKENYADEPISSKRISKKSLHSTLQLDDDQIERYNKKINDLEKKLAKEISEKKELKKEIGVLKESLDELQYGQQGLDQINEAMQSQYNKFYNLQNEYDVLLTAHADKERQLENQHNDTSKYREQVGSILKELQFAKEESLRKEKEIYQLKDEIVLLTDDKKNIKNTQTQQYETLIKQLQMELSDFKVQTSSYKNISDTYRQEIETLRRAIESQKETEENDKRQRDDVFRQNEHLKKEIDSYRSRLSESHREAEEYVAELRRVKQEKEKENINHLQLEDTIRELDHERKKILIERNQLENDLMNLREKVEATERQEVVAEKKIQELAKIKQTYEFDNEQLSHDLTSKVNELNHLNERVSLLTQKLQDMEEKNTQLSVLLNQEIEKQAIQFQHSMDSHQQLLNSTGKKPVSTSDLILNNQFSHSSKKSFGRPDNENIVVKSLVYSDQKQFDGNPRNELLRSASRQRSKSIDTTSLNVSQRTGSQHKNKLQNPQFNNTGNLSYIQTQPFESMLENGHKSYDNLNNLSHYSHEQLPTFSEYDFSNTKNRDLQFNSASKSSSKSADRFSFTPDQTQKNHIFVQENYEQRHQQPNQYKVRSASAQKLLNLIERTGEQSAKQSSLSPFRKTPEKTVTFSTSKNYESSTSPFTEQPITSKSNKKLQLEQIQEEKPAEDTYQSKDLLELTNVRQRLAEMRKTKDMVFTRMMDFDQKIKKFTEQQEKLLQKK